MKQTAVEFLMDKLFDASFDIERQIEWFDQAKEIERQQIIDAFNLGQQEEAKKEFWTKGAKYYEETYNK
jgi:hypothetical protein